jgi:hypothetical protein
MTTTGFDGAAAIAVEISSSCLPGSFNVAPIP